MDVGVIGLGAVAQAVHLPLLRKHPERFAIRAVCDASPSTLATVGDRLDLPAAARFDSAESLLAAADVEAVLILTPGSHAPSTDAALASGRHVFAEKPLAFTRRECRSLASRASESGRRLFVGYMKAYDPAVVTAAELVKGFDGALRSVEVVVLHPSAARQLAFAALPTVTPDVPAEVVRSAEAAWDGLSREALGDAPSTLRRLYTDVLLGSVIHDLAVIRALGLPRPEIDGARIWPSSAWPPSLEVGGRIGAEARLSIGWHYLPRYPAYREMVRLHFEDGSLELTFPSPYLIHRPTRLVHRRPDGDGERSERFASPVEAFEEELLAFHAAVTDGGPIGTGPVEALDDTIVCQAIATAVGRSEAIEVSGEAGALDA
jgi:predicted dehydrogenase